MDTDKGMLEEIREAEDECCSRLDEAKQEAEQIIAEKKREALRMIEGADDKGNEEARGLYEQERKKIDQEIEEMKRIGAAKVDLVLKQGELKLADAVRQIVHFVAFE